MGKGGESAVLKQSSTRTWQLEKLSTEELRKWAAAYGVKVEDKREALLPALEPYAGGILDPLRPANLPLTPPKFTLKMIKDAIPKHCFKRSLVTSFGHLFMDFIEIAILYYLTRFIPAASVSPLLHYPLWWIYWYAQGSVMTGVWVIAHECGHQAFSESSLINNTVGTICHSLLLVPYHPWRITHGKHHSNTGSCDNDEVFVPAVRSEMANSLRESPIAQLMGIVIMLTIGWIPGYLIMGITGPRKYKGKNTNHFSPSAVFFRKEDQPLVVQSDIAFFAALALLCYAVYTFGVVNVGAIYFIPYLVVNYHLVLITFLQHTDVFMPHFRGEEWNWLRGALCTVDRSFGVVLDHTLHHIVDTHVCHHLFSTMPFYHAQEATKAIKEVLGPYYMEDKTPTNHALWRAFSNCQYVEDTGNIVFYKNKFD